MLGIFRFPNNFPDFHVFSSKILIIIIRPSLFNWNDLMTWKDGSKIQVKHKESLKLAKFLPFKVGISYAWQIPCQVGKSFPPIRNTSLHI